MQKRDPGLVTRAIRHWVRRLPGSARRTGARLLREAPIPAGVRRLLREAVHPSPTLMSVPPGIDRALGYRAAEDDPDYVAWTLLNALTPEVLAAASRRVATFRRRPLISVLVPVRDPDPRVLEMALHSVDAQAYPDWELCIVDDGCAQPSIIELLQAYAGHRPGRACLRRLRSSTHIAGATNAALELARGEYVAFLDHDDELTP